MRLTSGPLAPLRNREFRLLWTGMTTSLIGNGILLVALAWQGYDPSGLPAAMPRARGAPSPSLMGAGPVLVARAWRVSAVSGFPAAMSAVGVALSLPQVVTLLIGGVV